MLQLSDSDAPERSAPRPGERMGGGLLGSSLLHLLVVLLALLGQPWLMQAPRPALHIMPVDLVQLGETSASPPAAETAALPQQRAAEVAPADSSAAVPLAQTPPARLAPREAAPKPERPITSRSAQPSQSSPPRPPSRPAASPADALSRRLEQLAQLKQEPPPIPAAPRRQEGAGASNLAAASAASRAARDASYGVKDFLRAQIERHWNPDRQALHSDWRVSIHILLDRDGSVRRADIIDDPLYRSDTAYGEFARSARNAVLLSSPLAVPPGAYRLPEEVTLDFDLEQDAR
jgi:hypothetical protein